MKNVNGANSVSKKMRKGEDIDERLLDFAARIGKSVNALPHSKNQPPQS